jgi:hypothetical protein
MGPIAAICLPSLKIFRMKISSCSKRERMGQKLMHQIQLSALAD